MKKFLIAHPDHFTQRAVEVTLRDLNYTTTHARDGLDAIDQALEDPPDAIILGTNYSDLSGLDVARTFRALVPTQNIPILFITNDAQDTEAVREAALSMADWVEAPLDLAKLREHLTRLLQEPAVIPVGREADAERELSSISDSLTGLYARHYMLHRLAYEAARAARYRHPIATLVLAIRDPDEILTRHGQIGADRIVVGIANVLRRDLRVADLVGRTADDEFLVIAPHTDSAGALVLAKRVRATILKTTFDVNGKDVQVQVLVGVAAASSSNLTDNLSLFGRAEAALDRARQEHEEPVIMG